MKLPELPSRLKLGQYYIGPDYPGCINSGIAPAIINSRILKSLRETKRYRQTPDGRVGTYPVTNARYIVGPIGAIQDFCQREPYHRYFDSTQLSRAQSVRVWHDPRYTRKDGKVNPNHTIYFFTNAASAKKKFLHMCAEMVRAHEEERAKRIELTKKAQQTGHPTDTFNLAMHMLDN